MPSKEAVNYLKGKIALKIEELENKDMYRMFLRRSDEARHANKSSALCPHFTKSRKRPAASNQKDSFEIKTAKERGKRRRTEKKKKSIDQSIRWKSYGGHGHFFARILKDEYQHVVQNAHQLSNFLYNVIFHARLFVNHSIIQNKELSSQDFIGDSNFWYSVCQLEMGIPVSNPNFINSSVVLSLNDFISDYPSILYTLEFHPMTEYNDPLAYACSVLGTYYFNHIIKNFEKRIKPYLRFKLKSYSSEFSQQQISGKELLEVKYLGHVQLIWTEDLKSNVLVFTNVVQTDSFNISFLFPRKKKKQLRNHVKFELSDFKTHEMKCFLPTAIVSGRNEIFTAAIRSLDREDIQNRKVSAEEGKVYNGYMRRNNYVEKLKVRKDLKEIESAIPTMKTANQELYESKQRADDEIANIVLDGGKNYTKKKRKKTKVNRKQRKRGSENQASGQGKSVCSLATEFIYTITESSFSNFQ
ncbi:MAG: hypothetical protein EXX96DRAFT_610437 [Benjaminiella poitrasii]|nr:MAG: hypothetical protein EXX96DRAFT_610437 [Benjaminiella poitrasii]